MEQDIMVLLVDSVHGVYAWQALVERHILFVAKDSNKSPVPLINIVAKDEDLQKGIHIDLDVNGSYYSENLEWLFSPKNDDYCENIDWLAFMNTLLVQYSEGQFYRVEQIDGDIYAINIDAVWCDEVGTYVMEEV